MTEIVIKTNNLSKRFKKTVAVQNLNLEINKGETIGFIGPNGAGKTTTIKLFAGLLRPTSGKILIINNKGDLQDIGLNSRDLISMGFLIDIPVFYDSTPYVLLKHYAKLHKYPNDRIDQQIDNLLSYFNLDNWKKKRIKNFSKGMKQKLGFIQAIIHEPEIILLDEPQIGLDPKSRIKIREYLKTLKEKNKTIFISSHMLHEISEICDKIALINDGVLIKVDFIENLGKLLKTNEIVCQLLDPIPPERFESVKRRLYEKLGPFLDRNLDSPINYQPLSKDLLIYYDGNLESKGEIFKILGKDFNSIFTIISFSQSKISSLEKLYSEMIK
ncbi:MAG: ABC transporter ATP-binding protein [Candidatus Thorarchaeota archaeon]